MSTRRINNQKGFSIVELMLALGLGLVVVTGIVQLFIGNSQTSALIAGQARLQENARFAFDFISRATRRAGYFGCSPQAENIVRGLVGDYNLLPEYDITQFIDGHESNGDGTWTPPLTGLPGGTPGNMAGEPVAAIEALGGLSRSYGLERPRYSSLAQSGLQLLRALPQDPDLDAWRSEVERNLRARLR